MAACGACSAGHSARDWVLVLGAEAQKRLRREERSFLYLKLSLAAAILGVIVGIIGIVVTAMSIRRWPKARYV